MILNVFSITELLIGSLSVVVTAWSAIFAVILAVRWKKSATASARLRVEERSHLLLLVAVVALGLRFLNWPFFYASLQSFVPEIEGAMCIFGVTQVQRIATGTGEMLKPFACFLVGGFLLLHMLDHRTTSSPLMVRKLLLLSIASLIVMLDSIIDGFLMLSIAPGQLVSCCTTVTDILDRPTRMYPKATFGPNYLPVLEYAYYVSSIVLLIILGCCWATVKSTAWTHRRAALGFLFACSTVHAAVFTLVQIEAHAPRIMGLPFHHCLYCLWQYVPDTIVMHTLFILGTFAIGWAFLLDLIARTTETNEILPSCLGRLLGFSMICVVASLIMNTVHLMVA